MKFAFIRNFVLIIALTSVFIGMSKNEVLSMENEKVIISGHPEFPPTMYRNGNRIDGVGPELAEMILKILNVEVTNKYVGPWARVLHNAKIDKIDLIAGSYKTEERETFLDFIPTPFMSNPSVVFVKKGKTFSFEKWEDLKDRTGGGIIGDRFNPDFDEFLIKNSIKIERVSSVVQNLEKLLLGRIDFVPYSKYVGLIVSEEMGIKDEIEILPKPLFTGSFYLAVRKNILKKHISEIDKKIIEYRDNGTIKRLIDRHIKAYVALKKAGKKQ